LEIQKRSEKFTSLCKNVWSLLIKYNMSQSLYVLQLHCLGYSLPEDNKKDLPKNNLSLFRLCQRSNAFKNTDIPRIYACSTYRMTQVSVITSRNS